MNLFDTVKTFEQNKMCGCLKKIHSMSYGVPLVFCYSDQEVV